MFDKQTYLLNYAKKAVGSPPLILEVADTDIVRLCFPPSLVEYYNAIPYEYRVEGSICGGRSAIDIPDLATLLSMPDENVFFVGVTYVEHAKVEVATGIAVLFDPLYNIGTRFLQDVITEKEFYATAEHDFVGQPVYTLDLIKNKLYIGSGFSSASVGVTFGYGFMIPDYVLSSHLNIMGDLVAVELIKMIIAGRASIQMAGDPTMDIGTLQAIQTKLEESAQAGLSSIRIPVMIRG
jgi:hypothetical protein